MKINITQFKTRQVSMADLTPEQRSWAVDEANATGRPIEEIIKEVKENVDKD